MALLKKIGDTLGVLGLGELRARVQEATTAARGDGRRQRAERRERSWCRWPRA